VAWQHIHLSGTKFHTLYWSEKLQYDTAIKSLKEYGVKDKSDLINQEVSHKKNVNGVQPKLEAEKASTIPYISTLRNALYGLDRAQRAEKAQLHKEALKLTKDFKGKRHENGREMEVV